MKTNVVVHPLLVNLTQKQISPSVTITKVFLKHITWDNAKPDGTRNVGACWILSNSQSFKCDYALPDGTSVRFNGSFGNVVKSNDKPVTMFLSDSVTKESLPDRIVDLLREQWCGPDGNVCYLLTDSNSNTFLPMSSDECLAYLQPSESDDERVQPSVS